MLTSTLPRRALRTLAQRAPALRSHQHPRPSCRTHAPRPSTTCTTPFRNFSLSTRLRQEQQQKQQQPAETTATPQPPPPPSPTTCPPPPQGPPPPPRRRGRNIYTAAILLILGALTGTVVRVLVAPPPPAAPGTPLDDAMHAEIRARAAQLPLVQHLLSSPEWGARGRHHDAYSAIPADARSRRITTGPLGGSAGVGGYQHIFHNALTGEVVGVIYFGDATIGWPGVVHGGLIATILDEHSARAAVAELSGGVLTARLDLQYKRPTTSNAFYVVRARAVDDENLPEGERGKRERKLWVDATLEDLQGVTLVDGRALFVVPKGTNLKAVGEGF